MRDVSDYLGLRDSKIFLFYRDCVFLGCVFCFLVPIIARIVLFCYEKMRICFGKRHED